MQSTAVPRPLQVFPRAMWPKPHHIRGYAMWGGVVVAGALYLVQASSQRP